MDATVLRISPDSGAARQNGTTVTVTPSSASVRVGRLQSFAATLTGATGGVAWSVNDVPGGDGSVGTIDSSGQYLAPATPPAQTVTVRATSVSVPTASGSAVVTVLPLPSISSVSPASFPAGAFTLTVNGAGFTSGAVVSFGGAPLSTTVVSSTRLTATGTAAASPSVPVFATMTDGTVSNTVSVTVTAPTPPPVVGVTISPATASVRLKQSRQFTATVTGTSNTAVVWKVNGITGGNTTLGRVNQNGVYTAPRRVPSPATVTVSATSVADPSKSASAQVTISR
ncbi:MAG TPA: hypothetical protein VGQ37_01475 [Vicinamibacterales bacterium]|nr:hypothetical protein [Vicinamibacterales bacterium]